MSAIRRYTLDANILFYAVDTDDHSKHLIANHVVEAALNADCFVTMQALCELYNAISKKRPRHRSQAQQLITLLSGSMPVVSASPLDLAAAIKQHERRPIQFWDTLLWATARRHGCRTIVTEDAQDRPAIDGVRYLNPFAASPVELADLLRPENDSSQREGGR